MNSNLKINNGTGIAEIFIFNPTNQYMIKDKIDFIGMIEGIFAESIGHTYIHNITMSPDILFINPFYCIDDNSINGKLSEGNLIKIFNSTGQSLDEFLKEISNPNSSYFIKPYPVYPTDKLKVRYRIGTDFKKVVILDMEENISDTYFHLYNTFMSTSWYLYQERLEYGKQKLSNVGTFRSYSDIYWWPLYYGIKNLRLIYPSLSNYNKYGKRFYDSTINEFLERTTDWKEKIH